MKKYLMILVVIGFGAYAYSAYNKSKRANINLKK